MTPPPATSSGRRADRITSTARASAAGSGTGRATCQTRSANSSSGQSYACACTSCGSAIVAAPVSAGSVSTRIAPSSAAGSCSGRHTRSKNRDSGRNASLTVTSWPAGDSSSCSTGPDTRVANTSLGSSSTGSRFTVASAAPVSMFDEPGPIEAVQAQVVSRLRCRAYAAAACTMPCSLRAVTYGNPRGAPPPECPPTGGAAPSSLPTAELRAWLSYGNPRGAPPPECPPTGGAAPSSLPTAELRAWLSYGNPGGAPPPGGPPTGGAAPSSLPTAELRAWLSYGNPGGAPPPGGPPT